MDATGFDQIGQASSPCVIQREGTPRKMSWLSPVYMMNRWRFMCAFSVVCYRSIPNCKIYDT